MASSEKAEVFDEALADRGLKIGRDYRVIRPEKNKGKWKFILLNKEE